MARCGYWRQCGCEGFRPVRDVDGIPNWDVCVCGHSHNEHGGRLRTETKVQENTKKFLRIKKGN